MGIAYLSLNIFTNKLFSCSTWICKCRWEVWFLLRKLLITFGFCLFIYFGIASISFSTSDFGFFPFCEKEIIGVMLLHFFCQSSKKLCVYNLTYGSKISVGNYHLADYNFISLLIQLIKIVKNCVVLAQFVQICVCFKMNMDEK